MPPWKKILFGLIALIVLLILVGQATEAANIVNAIISGLVAFAKGIGEFFKNLHVGS